jgi:WD40 repeat protein
MNVDLKLINLSNKNTQPIIQKQAHSSEITILAHHKKLKNFISVSRDHIISFWDQKTLEKKVNITILEPISSGFLLGDEIYCIGESKNFYKFNVVERRKLKVEVKHENNSHLRLIPAGESSSSPNCIITDFNKDLYIYKNFENLNFSKGSESTNLVAPTKIFPGHLEDILSVKFISNSKIAIASTSNKISIVDLETGQWVFLDGHEESVLCFTTFF